MPVKTPGDQTKSRPISVHKCRVWIKALSSKISDRSALVPALLMMDGC